MKRISFLWTLAMGVIAAVAIMQTQRIFEETSKDKLVLVGEGTVQTQDVKPGVDALSAQNDLDSYFDKIPTHNVNSFHEPELQGNPNFGGLEERSPRHLASKDATADLLSYYSKIPTHRVNAFHEPTVASSQQDGGSPEHVRTKFSADRSRSELSRYFVGIPTHQVNAYHEPSQELGHTQQGLRGTSVAKNDAESTIQHIYRHGMTAADAQREMSSYFMQIPTKNVGADHTLRRPIPPTRVVSAPQLSKTLEAAVKVLKHQSLLLFNLPRATPSSPPCTARPLPR